MTAALPTAPPTSLRAGDTWSWRVALPDYPAPTWVLSYILYNTANKYTLTASAEGTGHLIAVAGTTTDDYAAGRYDWLASVASGAERYQINVGVIEITPNLAAISSGGYDGRSLARQTLDALDAALASRATGADLDILRTQLGDRSIQRDPAALLKWRQHFAARVAAEDQAAARARGESVGFVQMRF